MANTLVSIAKALAALLIVWGGVELASGLHDSSGHQVQTGIWQMVGGVVLVAAAIIVGGMLPNATSVPMTSPTGGWIAIDDSAYTWDTSHNVLKKQTEILAVRSGNLIDNVRTAFWSFLSNSGIQTAIEGAADGIAKSVGVPLLGLFALLEIISVARKFEGQGMTGLAIPFSVVARIVFAYEFVIGGLYKVIFDLLQYFGVLFFNGISDIGLSSTMEPQAKAMFDVVHNGWNDIGSNILATLGLYFQYFFLYIIVMLAFVGVGIAIITRLARLYLFLLAAPVAVSSFASSEFDHMGKGWLRGALSVSLEAGFIYAGLFIGTMIMQMILSGTVDFGGTGPLTGGLLRPILAVGSLVAIVFGAGGVAKQALGG
jgi:hypothetical protein